jgi:hypothetical protein
MCGCKDCQGITLLSGNDGKGIVSVTSNGNGTFTYLYTDGTTYITPNLNGANGTNGTNGATGATGATGPQGPAGVCPCEQVFYTTERLGMGSVGTSPTSTDITGTSYTVPVGTATALYRISYSAKITFEISSLFTGGSLTYNAYKNGVVLDTYVNNTSIFYSTFLQNFRFSTSFLLSDISLVAGDTINLIGTSTDSAKIYLSNATFILDKIS